MKLKAVALLALFFGLTSFPRAQQHAHGRLDQPNSWTALQSFSACIALHGQRICGPLAEGIGGGLVNVKAYGARGNGRVDDTSAIQEAINAAFAIGAIVYFPPGVYIANGPLQSACDAVLCVPEYDEARGHPYKLVGFQGTGATWPGKSVGDSSGTIISSTTTGIDQNSAIIGVHRNAPQGVDVYLDGIGFYTTLNPTLGCFNWTNTIGASANHYFCSGGDPWTTPTEPTHKVIGVGFPAVGNDTISEMRWYQVEGYYDSIVASEHTYFEGGWVAQCVNGYIFGANDHPIEGHLGVQECANAVVVSNYTAFNNVTLELETCRGSTSKVCQPWMTTAGAYDIQDPNSQAHGLINYHAVTAGIGPGGVATVNGGCNLLLFDTHFNQTVSPCYNGSHPALYDNVSGRYNGRMLESATNQGVGYWLGKSISGHPATAFWEWGMDWQGNGGKDMFFYDLQTQKYPWFVQPATDYEGFGTKAPSVPYDFAGTSGSNGFVDHPLAVTLANGANENVGTRGYSYLRASGNTAPASIGGFTAGYPGQRLKFQCVAQYPLTIINKDSGSSGGNQIDTLRNSNVTLTCAYGCVVDLFYDGTAGYWILGGTSPPQP
jgi:hypothetical protein